MLKETYLAKLHQMRKVYPNALFMVVTATAKHILAPPWDLVNIRKEIPWEEYRARYLAHIQRNPVALRELRRIKHLAESKDVFLVCYERNPKRCHRSILIEMINNLEDD